MDGFIRNIPKAELHVHIEGTLEPELMLALAERNSVKLPFESADEIRAAYAFDGLQSFLDIYYQGMAVLRQEQDFYELARAYLLRAHGQAVRHTEVFFDPQAHTERGVPLGAVVTGLRRALVEAEEELGMSTRLILCFLRHLSPESALETLQEALPFRDEIVAVGLDSSEAGRPPSLFREVFDRAREEGFLSVAHAGEEGPPEYVRQALDELGVSRVDHGVRSAEDPRLLARLAEEQVPLTVCPLSNVKLGVFSSLPQHNLRALMDAGLCVTVNSDDPAYFGGYVAENLFAVQQALGLDREAIRTLAVNAFRASFLDEASKRERLEEVQAYVDGDG